MDLTTFKKPAFSVGVLAGILLLPTWIYLNSLQAELANRPNQPQPEMGWTVPFKTKTGTIYVSPEEDRWGHILPYVDMGLFGVMIGCLFFSAGPLSSMRGK